MLLDRTVSKARAEGASAAYLDARRVHAGMRRVVATDQGMQRPAPPMRVGSGRRDEEAVAWRRQRVACSDARRNDTHGRCQASNGVQGERCLGRGEGGEGVSGAGDVGRSWRRLRISICARIATGGGCRGATAWRWCACV